jgi:hypothetical protein
MRDFIDQLQSDAALSQTQTPASLSRILLHMVNIQKVADQPSEDSANAVKRLRDFANTIERLDLRGESMTTSHDIQGQLIAVLRLAADQILGPAAAAKWAAGSDSGRVVKRFFKTRIEPRCRDSIRASIISP